MITNPRDIISDELIARKIRKAGMPPDTSAKDISGHVCSIAEAFDEVRVVLAAIASAKRKLAGHFRYAVGTDVLRGDGTKIAVDKVTTSVWFDDDDMVLVIDVNGWGHVRGSRNRKTKCYEHVRLMRCKF